LSPAADSNTEAGKTEMTPVTSKPDAKTELTESHTKNQANQTSADADSNKPATAQASQEANLDQKPEPKAADTPPSLDEPSKSKDQ
jgi:hypothetical protein